MISFESDYTTGVHPQILQRLAETNLEPLSGYGNDFYSKNAKEKIKAACQCPAADIYFLVGGTQTNMIIISALLKDYEGVLAANTGHINTHEAGAIEYTGHKILPLPQNNGKISPESLKNYLKDFYQDNNREHMVFPGMVYISHPTEYGTLYSRQELEEISSTCHQYQIPLFLDGARLGYGLMSLSTDVTLPDIAHLCDVFYIGGTKVGALCGEAVVFTKNNTPSHFSTRIKQHGALLAKGRLLGIQFDTLFTDDLYFRISKHAIDMSEKLKACFQGKGYQFYLSSPTNQQFIVLENAKLEKLKRNIIFSFWEKADMNHTIVRFATSWSTKETDIQQLKKYL